MADTNNNNSAAKAAKNKRKHAAQKQKKGEKTEDEKFDELIAELQQSNLKEQGASSTQKGERKPANPLARASLQMKCSPISGLGLFATRSIVKGHHIFVEDPLLCAGETANALRLYRIEAEFAGLSDEKKALLMKTTHECKCKMVPCQETEATQIYNANNVLATNGLDYVYCHLNRVNHSCSPNARLIFRPTGRLLVVATKEIRPGHEITIAYPDFIEGNKLKRQEQLQRTFSFICKCSICSMAEDRITLDGDFQRINPTNPEGPIFNQRTPEERKELVKVDKWIRELMQYYETSARSLEKAVDVCMAFKLGGYGKISWRPALQEAYEDWAYYIKSNNEFGFEQGVRDKLEKTIPKLLFVRGLDRKQFNATSFATDPEGFLARSDQMRQRALLKGPDAERERDRDKLEGADVGVVRIKYVMEFRERKMFIKIVKVEDDDTDEDENDGCV